MSNRVSTQFEPFTPRWMTPGRRRPVRQLEGEMPFMTQPTIDSMSPFFIVGDVETAVAFYRDKLGFEVQFQQPDENPFFAIVGRGGAMLFLKSGEAGPLPNPTRDPEMRWDAYCHTPDPDALAADFAQRGAPFSTPLKDTSDGLRGFEITDPDGYVLFFGCPR